MILLDSDHVTVLRYVESAAYASLTGRLQDSGDRDIATTIISIEEEMRGWLGLVSRTREARKQVAAYRRLGELFDFYAE